MTRLSPEIREQVELQVNNMMLENMRTQLVRAQGSSDSKRPQAWCEYGYPISIDNSDLHHMWDRNALAFGAVAILHEKCWEDNPQILQGTEKENDADKLTPWDKKTESFLTNGEVLDYFSQADLYRIVDGWSGLLIQYQDGGNWDQPLKGGVKNVTKLIPAWAHQLTPLDINSDQKSANYGDPAAWQFDEGRLTNSTEASAAIAPRQIKVHSDRILILGDWRNGRSELRAPYNNFINTEKIEGGSGESFLKNAARQVAINFDKEVKLEEIARAYGVQPEEMQEIFDKVAKSFNRGIDSVLMTQGATTTAIQSNVPDPQPHYNINIQSIAAAMRIPAKVLVGMQTGERASTEDLKQFNKRCQGRRVKVIDKDLRKMVNKFVQAKALDSVSQFYVKWNDLNESTAAEKLDNADKMAGINQKNSLNGETFTREQIVTAAGLEMESDAEPLPEDDEEITE